MNKLVEQHGQLIGDRQKDRLLRRSFANKDSSSVQLRFNHIYAYDRISRPRKYAVDLLFADPNCLLKILQGKMLRVQMVRGDWSLRYFTLRVGEDGFSECSPARRIVSGSVALTSFDLKSPHPVSHRYLLSTSRGRAKHRILRIHRAFGLQGRVKAFTSLA